MKENWDELPNAPSPVAGAVAAAAATATADSIESDMDEASAAGGSSNASAGRISYHIEQEKSLPGIVMASGSHNVFTMLYQLSEVDDPK